MKCLVCNNAQGFHRREEGISFHKFPKNPEQRKEWVRELGFPHFYPSDIDVLCSEHFTRDAFKKWSKNNCRLLKRDAVPVKYLNGKSLNGTVAPIQQTSSSLSKRISNSMDLKIVDVCSLSENGITPPESVRKESNSLQKKSVPSENLMNSAKKRKTEPSNVSVVLANDNVEPVYFYIQELEAEKQLPSYDSISLLSSSSEDDCESGEDDPDQADYPVLSQQMLEQNLSLDNSWLDHNESGLEEQNTIESKMNIAGKKWRGLQAMLESDEANDTTEELLAKIACLKDVCVKRNKMIKNLHQINRRKDDKMARLETILFSFKGHVNYSKLKLNSQCKTTLSQIWDGKPRVIERRKYKKSQGRSSR